MSESKITFADIFGPLRDKNGTVTVIAMEVNGKKAHVYKEKEVRIVGTQFRNDDGEKLFRQAIIQHLKTKMELNPNGQHTLNLHRESNNEFDKNAIGVWYEPDGVTPDFTTPIGRIGFLPKELAAAIAGDLDSGDFKPSILVSNVKKNHQGLLVVNGNIFQYLE